MLVNLIKHLFAKYIYTPHEHDYEFDRKESRHTDFMGLEADRDVFIYKCRGCGEVEVIKEK